MNNYLKSKNEDEDLTSFLIFTTNQLLNIVSLYFVMIGNTNLFNQAQEVQYYYNTIEQPQMENFDSPYQNELQ